MKHILTFLTSVVFAMFAGATFALATGADAMVSMAGALGLSFGMSLLPGQASAGLHAVVLRQMWETALIEPFRNLGDFLTNIPRKDQYVDNNVINLAEIGADPAVLINNTTYPIATSSRTDDNNALALFKYDTENTKITDDELYALPYDKSGSVVRQHREALMEKIQDHSLHGLCVSADGANTPVLETTGADDGAGRKRLKSSDLIALQLRLDNLKVPARGRRLVLCPEHCADLLLEDTTFAQRLHSAKDGLISDSYYGFETYKYSAAPVFNTGGTKKAFGAAGAAGDRKASVMFLVGRSWTAMGSLKFYFQDSAQSPTTRESVAGYRVYSATLPMKNTGFAAVISANV